MVPGCSLTQHQVNSTAGSTLTLRSIGDFPACALDCFVPFSHHFFTTMLTVVHESSVMVMSLVSLMSTKETVINGPVP